MRFCIFCRLLFWVVSWKFNLHLDIFHNEKCVLFLPPFQVFIKDIHIILSGRIQALLPRFGKKSLKLMGYFGTFGFGPPFGAMGPLFGPFFSEILDPPPNFTN